MANKLEMLVFIDESEPLKAPLVLAQWRTLKTNLVKTTGWAPVGARLIDHARFGHWHSQTHAFAGLGCDGLVALWVLDGAMNRASFDASVEPRLAPALRPGQILASGK